jgi:hypothetical protein
MSNGITKTPKRIERVFLSGETNFPEYLKLRKSFSVETGSFAQRGAKKVIPNARPIIP